MDSTPSSAGERSVTPSALAEEDPWSRKPWNSRTNVCSILITITSLAVRLTPDFKTFPYARFARMTSARIYFSGIIVMPIFAPSPLNALSHKNGLIKEDRSRLSEQFYHFLE
ncbi:hypothetical protein Y032_0232g3050 [Ancylostoma ceylanicum]|nr:hypothetical protein Y032_0232g3050 [Ancylostoma ceylanicum]